MKKSEIEIGGMYSNGKGRVRRIIEEGPFKLYSGQTDTDCVKYVTVKAGNKRNLQRESAMTRASFATWAKERVVEP